MKLEIRNHNGIDVYLVWIKQYCAWFAELNGEKYGQFIIIGDYEDFSKKSYELMLEDVNLHFKVLEINAKESLDNLIKNGDNKSIATGEGVTGDKS